MPYNNGTLTLLGKSILPGESAELQFSIAKLHTSSPVDVPVIIERAKQPGPTVLFIAGIHGDELNGIDILRQLITKKINKPKIGTVICIPIVNIFGFINLQRNFPDGRDLNRVFPGTKSGSLASRVAYHLMNEIIPKVDYVVDFHTGGANRFNAPQVRIAPGDQEYNKLAKIFGAPFVLYSKNIKKSFRSACNKRHIPVILFEGGKSLHIDETIAEIGVQGSSRFLFHLGMLSNPNCLIHANVASVFIEESRWIRAKYSGLFKSKFKPGAFVEKNVTIGIITDPFGKLNYSVKSSNSGYLINVNEASVVYQGDALFHISLKIEHQ